MFQLTHMILINNIKPSWTWSNKYSICNIIHPYPR